MSTNLKYFQLLQQIEKNPLRPKVAPAFDIASDFKLDMERVAANRFSDTLSSLNGSWRWSRLAQFATIGNETYNRK